MTPRPRLLVLNPTCLDVIDAHRAWIESLGVELVAEPGFRQLTLDQADRLLGDAEAVILPAAIRTLPHADQMKRCPRLKSLSIAASGYDWLDVAAATRCGMIVTNVEGGAGSEVVADMAFALMLAVARQVPHHDRLIQRGDHTRGMGVCLWGKTLGILGLGHVSRAIIRRARGFDMTVLVATSHPDLTLPGVRYVPVAELLGQSDFVSLHQRLTNTNVGWFGPDQFALMKSTAIFINTARRELVDEGAMIEAITNNRIAGAALDDPPSRPDNPLLGRPNVVFTPHLGNRAIEGVTAVFRQAVESAVAVLRGERPHNVVNPEVYP